MSAIDVSRIPPHDLDAERSVLGVVIVENAALGRLRQILPAPSFFYKDAHQIIFTAMLDLHERGSAITLTTLRDALRECGQLEQVGGPLTLAALIEETAITAHVESHARIVRTKALKREIARRATALATEAFDDRADVDALAASVSALHQDVRAAAGPLDLTARSVRDVLADVLDELKRGAPPAIATPWPALNALLNGGLRPGELSYFGGRPSLGKTAMAVQWSSHAARQQVPTLVISREMTLQALGRRVLAQQAQVFASALRAGALTDSDWTRINEVVTQLEGRPLFFSAQAGSVEQIEALVAAASTPYRFLVVDYLQLVRAPKAKDRRLEVEHVSLRLKALAVDHGLAVCCLSSLARPVDSTRAPTLASLRESGALEHDADVVGLLHRPYDDRDQVDLIIAKARDGATGTVRLSYRGLTLTFQELSSREPGDEVPF